MPGSSSFNYFPTERGKYVVFEVDSILHGDNDNNTDDSVYSWHFQVKETIDETFIDGQGRSAQIIRRYRRDNDMLPWNEMTRWTQVLTASSAYRTEDNVPYHKLSFPVGSPTPWNGNDANTEDEELYSYEDFNASLALNSFSFDSTLSVLQRDDNNFVEKIYAKEIYANHIGLIYKERDNLNKVNGMIVKGTEFKMKVIGYGWE